MELIQDHDSHSFNWAEIVDAEQNRKEAEQHQQHDRHLLNAEDHQEDNKKEIEDEMLSETCENVTKDNLNSSWNNHYLSSCSEHRV